MKDKLKKLYEERNKIENEINKINFENLKNKLEYNKLNYVGKYYKIDNKYIKIISELSINEYHVTGIEFNLPINIQIMPIISKHSIYSYNECNIIFESLKVKNYFIGNNKINKSIMDYGEITAKEYYNAMEEYFKQIIEFTNKKIVYNFDKKNYEIK